MTIHETKDVILVWIKSCTKPEQIELLVDVVAEFIVNRFEKLETNITIEITRDFLIDEMAEQKMIIKRNMLQSFNYNVSSDYDYE